MVIIIIVNNFLYESKKLYEEEFNVFSFIHFPPSLLKHDYINHPGNPCYSEKIAHGDTTARVFIYTSIKLKNSIYYEMIKCALSKSGFYVEDEIIHIMSYNRKKFCQETIKKQSSHNYLHLWLDWSVELKLKVKNHQKDHVGFDFPFSCSPDVRNNNNVYINVHLFGELNELTDDSGEKLNYLDIKSSEYINLVNDEKKISSKIDSDVLPFIEAKTVTRDGFGYNKLILPGLMYQLFDFFDVANMLINQPKWKSITESQLNYMPPISRYDKDDVLQKEFAFIDSNN
uniref:Glycosyltransferase family 92 protein n=1 Tax=Strongyloides papillosus TaxID=174720 RepID=A0A0N5BW65_STREA